MLRTVLAVSIVAMATAAFADPASNLMTPAEFQALPIVKADVRLRYGRNTNQFGDLRLPPGKGPHAVAVLIHGGCFRADFAKLDELSQMGEALRRDGIATWNIEYRRLGQPGGGWPGTYQDVGRAIDHLRVLARRYPLDLTNVVIIGHSAGGHLAHWSGSRSKIPVGNPLSARSPIKPLGIINLAGLPDLRQNVAHYEAECQRPVVQEMLGGDPSERYENARLATPTERLPLGVQQTLILGEFENFVPRAIAEAYVNEARLAGDQATLVVIPGAGHFEIAASTSQAWPQVRQAVLDTLASGAAKEP
jgi:acetyl esterase/lipase